MSSSGYMNSNNPLSNSNNMNGLVYSPIQPTPSSASMLNAGADTEMEGIQMSSDSSAPTSTIPASSNAMAYQQQQQQSNTQLNYSIEHPLGILYSI